MKARSENESESDNGQMTATKSYSVIINYVLNCDLHIGTGERLSQHALEGRPRGFVVCN